MKEVEKDVDDVEVDAQGCKDVLVRRDGVLVVAADQELDVEEQKSGEDDDADAAVRQVDVPETNDKTFLSFQKTLKY